jgi:hypothetical protein
MNYHLLSVPYIDTFLICLIIVQQMWKYMKNNYAWYIVVYVVKKFQRDVLFYSSMKN